MDMRHTYAFFTGWLTLGIGLILATFHVCGNDRILLKEFMMGMS